MGHRWGVGLYQSRAALAELGGLFESISDLQKPPLVILKPHIVFSTNS